MVFWHWHLWLFALNLFGQFLIIDPIKKGEVFQFDQFNLIWPIVSGVPQIIENPINLYHVSYFDVQMPILMCHVHVGIHINAQFIHLFNDRLLFTFKVISCRIRG